MLDLHFPTESIFDRSTSTFGEGPHLLSLKASKFAYNQTIDQFNRQYNSALSTQYILRTFIAI